MKLERGEFSVQASKLMEALTVGQQIVETPLMTYLILATEMSYFYSLYERSD